MTQVDFGRRTWVLSEDLDALRSAPTSQEERVLPPHDTCTQLLDREVIVDKRYHPNVWKTVGDPATVFARGRITGIWRQRKTGQQLTISIKTFGSLSLHYKESLQADAEWVAPRTPLLHPAARSFSFLNTSRARTLRLRRSELLHILQRPVQ